MYGESSAQESDVLLSPFLNATSEAESENLLTSLLEEQAGPVIKRIIRRKLDDRFRGQEAEDVYCEVVMQLVERLRLCKARPVSDGIRDFRNYVAVTTYNACYEILRSKYPERRRLKNRLKYLLTHHPAFNLWLTPEGYWLGGFATWTTRHEIVASGKLQQLFETPEMLASPATGPDVSCERLVNLLEAIFRKLDAPVEFEGLVNSVADLQGIKDVSEPTNFDEQKVGAKGASESFVVEVEQRSYLRRLWSEIVQLPLSQRAALLLNLRDINEGVVMLLPVTGVATIRQIAETLEIPAEEFSRLWNRLPLDDAAIALRLGVSRQGVINLRKSARARLFRRMRGIAPKTSK
jgi:DNA-directed RNA polymerase specialized sigma24 family protein